MNYKQSAEDILNAIGGEENLDAMAHCATRLRLVLNDESLVNEEALNNMDVVKGTFSTGGQYQIIIGSGTVNKVFTAICKNAVRYLCSDYTSHRCWWFINGVK